MYPFRIFLFYCVRALHGQLLTYGTVNSRSDMQRTCVPMHLLVVRLLMANYLQTDHTKLSKNDDNTQLALHLY